MLSDHTIKGDHKDRIEKTSTSFICLSPLENIPK
jgi:hypothetical protein